MRLSEQEVDTVGKEIEKAEHILVISHKNPDGDTAGAALAMYEMLKNMGKNPQYFCIDPLPEDFHFLPNNEVVIHEFDENDYDLIIMIDAAAKYMCGIHETHPNIYGGKFPLVNIDHHPSNEHFGRWNLIDTEAASATIVLTHMFNHLGWKITPNIATCLLTGVYTDTGSLKHSNADAEVHRVSAQLLRKGGRLREIIKNIFKNTDVATLQLWGRVMKRITKTPDNITISYVSDHDFADTGTDISDLTGVVDYLNSVPDASFALLLTEYRGKVKGSLRTLREDVDLTEIAGKFGGGGHKKASGFTLEGELQMQTRFAIEAKDQIYKDEMLFV